MSLELVIAGEPFAKERPRKGQHGNIYTPRGTKEHEDMIALIARAERRTFEGPVSLSTVFYTARSSAKFDGDNAHKLVADALQKAGVYKNDRQIKEGHYAVVEAASARTWICVNEFDPSVYAA